MKNHKIPNGKEEVRTEGANEPKRQNSLVVFADKDINSDEAKQLANRLNVELMQDWSDVKQADLVLRLDSDGIALVSDKMVLRGDFVQMLPRIKAGNLQKELLVRASKMKGTSSNLTAIDATAGLGEDALLLAAAGFSVRLYEYDSVIALLLQDALNRAAIVPELTDIVGRMKLFQENSIFSLQNLVEQPDLVLLDPMFPARHKSALIKKKFQLLQQLECPCTDESALIHAAIAAEPRKVVIKRPLKGSYLAGYKPDYSLKSKVIRFDCLVLPR